MTVNTHTKLILSLTLFLLIFCILGLPLTQWGFKTDDWGNIYHSILNTWDSIVWAFTHNIEATYYTDYNPAPPQAFFQGLYRPLSFVYYYVQYCIFGIKPYGYLLVTAALHAGNTVLLFLLFSRIANTTNAFLAAAFFGFHPSLWLWFGWTSAQTYFIELFVLLLLIMSLLRFVATKQLGFYVLACTLFLLNIFLKEQTIFLPLWLIGAFYFYRQCKDWIPGPSRRPNVAMAGRQARDDKRKSNTIIPLLYSSGFWAIVCFYITVRLHFFPLTNQTGTLTFEPTWQSFITRMSSRLFDFVTYGNDLLGFSWLPWGHQILKGSLIIAALCALGFLFWHNSKKPFILFCALSIPLFSWPALLMHYQPRYLYMAIPLSLCIVLLLFTFYRGPRVFKTNRWLIAGTTIFIACNAVFLIRHLQRRQTILHTITTAFSDLVNNPQSKDRCLCFFNLPSDWFAMGTPQAVWLLRNDSSKRVYQVDSLPTNSAGVPQEIKAHNPLLITWNYEKNNFKIV